MPGAPTLPNAPRLPGAPTLPITPRLPGTPPLPNAPRLPGAPTLPNAPRLPGASSVPAPRLPGAPSLPGAPRLPGAPSMPGAPRLPGAPQVPGQPNAPRLPGAPGAPRLPGGPGAPRLPGGPGAPRMPGAQNNAPVVYKPVATKPVIKLDKKVKALHWNKVLLLPKEAPDRPDYIWNDLKEIDLNIDDIASSFETKVFKYKLGCYYSTSHSFTTNCRHQQEENLFGREKKSVGCNYNV